MARRLITLSGRLVLAALLFHAVLLPVLYLAIVTVVERNATNAFLDDSRVHGRVLADSFEALEPDQEKRAVTEQLDSILLGGRVVYATLQQGDELVAGSLMSDADVSSFKEDFAFGDHDDSTYFESLPVVSRDGNAVLRLGFDESPTQANLEAIRQSIVMVLSAYLLITLVAAIYTSAIVIRPIQWLQRISRTIASGDYGKHLDTDSNVREINELALDLEHMRSKLVGTYERLQVEIREREAAESERRLLESRLRHTQRLESLGTMAGGVAHEFNNVLQPMLLYTELALEDVPRESPVSHNLERVLDLANRAKGLSRQILTFGRQTDDIVFEKVSIVAVVEEAIAMIRALLPATVDIRVDIQGDTGTVDCGAAQIQQLLVNLCNNASQALSKGGHIHVGVYRKHVDEDAVWRGAHLTVGDFAVIEVADTGCGMDEATRRRVFEPFFTTRDVGQGTGLGLSVVHGIVMRHNGEVTIESEPGEGTTIRVYLPLVIDAAGQTEMAG